MSETKTMFGGDERLKKSAAPEVRGDRATTADEQRTQQDGTMTTLQERMQMIRSEWTNDVLPNPPVRAGWHYCWLSTTNSTDPIYKRIQKGYQPVKVDEIPGFTQYKVTQGEFEGCVACNEMLLFKIEEELYQEIMKIFHYERPNEEEEMLRANAPGTEKDSKGRNLGEVEGFDNLAVRVRAPTFN